MLVRRNHLLLSTKKIDKIIRIKVYLKSCVGINIWQCPIVSIENNFYYIINKGLQEFVNSYKVKISEERF